MIEIIGHVQRIGRLNRPPACALQGVGPDYSLTFLLMQTPSNMQYPSYLGHSRPLEDLKMTLKPLSSITLQVSDSSLLFSSGRS